MEDCVQYHTEISSRNTLLRGIIVFSIFESHSELPSDESWTLPDVIPTQDVPIEIFSAGKVEKTNKLHQEVLQGQGALGIAIVMLSA